MCREEIIQRLANASTDDNKSIYDFTRHVTHVQKSVPGTSCTR